VRAAIDIATRYYFFAIRLFSATSRVIPAYGVFAESAASATAVVEWRTFVRAASFQVAASDDARAAPAYRARACAKFRPRTYVHLIG
jgi:hypothetical protein